MAFDGIVVAGLVHELKQKLTDGRIAKREKDDAGRACGKDLCDG